MLFNKTIFLKPVSPLNQARNWHFQNYQKWSSFNWNYPNRRTYEVWLMVLSNKIDTACFQIWWVDVVTNAAGCHRPPRSAAMSNTEYSWYQESFLLLFVYDPTTFLWRKQPKTKIWLVQKFKPRRFWNNRFFLIQLDPAAKPVLRHVVAPSSPPSATISYGQWILTEPV